MNSLSWILLVSLCSLCLKARSAPRFEWGKAIDVSGVTEELVDYEMDIDQETQVLHTVWCHKENNNYVLHYRRVDKKGTLNPPQLLDAEHRCISVDVEVWSSTNIFVVYFASRTQTNQPCSKDKAGCWDVYYRESKDGGNTWSTIQAVPRSDMNDGADRIFIGVESFQRVFLFYEIRREGKASLGVVMRPPGTDIFQNERIIADNYDSSKADTSLTRSNSQVKVQVFHTTYSSHILGSYFTTNNGATWTHATFSFDDQITAVYATSGTQGHPATIFLNYIQNNGNTRFVWSNDEGNTWSHPVVLPGQCYSEMPTCECADMNLLLAALIADGTRLRVGSISMSDGQFVEFNPPLCTLSIQNPKFACHCSIGGSIGAFLSLVDPTPSNMHFYVYYGQGTPQYLNPK